MKRISLVFALILFATQIAAAQEKTAALASAPASAAKSSSAKAAATMSEMQQQLSALTEMIQSYQEQMEELRTEVKDLKAQIKTSDQMAQVKQGEEPKMFALATPPVAAAGMPGASSSSAPAPAPATAAAPQTQGPASAALDKMVESVMPGLKLSGVVWLYDYQPFGLPGSVQTRPTFDLYGFHLKLDRDTGRLGFHVEYRMRTTKLRPFFVGPTWAEEAYAKVHIPFGTVKMGEMFKQYGIFTDYSFYGGLPYFDGLKYDPEWGVSYEGNNKITDRISLEHDVQYFRTDARANGSEPGRDAVSDPNARRRNEFVARVVPHFKLTDKISLSFGPSFERGQVTHSFDTTNDYWRAGGEATLDVGPVKVYGEVIHQDFNGPQFAYLPQVTYTTVGLNSNITSWLSTHINYGQGNYSTQFFDGEPTVRGKEQIIQPGLVFTLGKGYAIYTEYNYWLQRPTHNVSNLFDRSFNTAFYIAF